MTMKISCCLNKRHRRQGRKMITILPCSSRDNLSAPLHIKLFLMRNFVKGIAKTSHGFDYVRNKIPNVNDGNLKMLYL